MLPKFLTTQYPLEKHFFLIPRFSFGILGFYPETKRNTIVRLWSFLNFAILSYGIYAEFYYGIYYLSIDVPTALDALCPVATSFMSLLKLFFIWWFGDEFKYLIERLRVLTAEQSSKEKTHTKKIYFTLATRLNTLVLILGFCCSTTYSLRPIVTNTILYLNGEDIIYDTPFKMMFPERLLSMPVYPLTYLLVHWHGYITILAFSGAGGLFLGFCLYTTTLWKALQKDLQLNLADMNNTGQSRLNTEKKVCRTLETLIERQNEIVQLTEKFSLIMVEITLTQFITSGVIIASSVVDILLFSGLSVLVYVAYTGAVFSEMFLYCFGGNSVMESSAEVATQVYCSCWYTHSVKIQRMALLIIVRSQRKIVIKVPFFSPSLPALTAILRFTGSVIALAKSVI